MTQTPASETRVLGALSNVPIFSQLDDKNRRKLAKLCVLKSFQAGDVILEEGTMALGLFVVTSGRVEIYKSSNGNRIQLGEVEAGGVLGQVALLDDQPRSASAAALDTVECLLLTRDSFDTLVKRDPEIAWSLVPGIVGRVRDLESRAMRTELELEELKRQDVTEARASAGQSTAAEAAEPEEEAADEKADEDDDEVSDVESAFYKMMRMQFGLMAGAAKGVTEMSRLMETFLDSLADETDLKNSEDWRDMLEKIPDAMVTATREVMDKGEKVPDEMVDAYHRYSDIDK